MSATARGSQALRLLSFAVVGVWLGGYFAWSALELAAPLEPLLELSRVALRAELAPELPAPVEPELAADEPPEPARSEQAVPVDVTASELARGERLLAVTGSFPVLSAGYEDFRSFRSYARAMGSLGARFVVILDREIVGAADLERGHLGAAGSLAGFSPRARNYTGEPALAALTRRAAERYGEGAVIRMLIPRKLDAGLFGSIERRLAERGDSHDRYTELRGRYAPAPDGGAHFRIESAMRKDGSEVALELVFDLGQIAGVEPDAGPRA